MKSILAITLLIATLSLCNLADKSKPETNSAPPNTNTAQKPEIDRVALTVELMRLEHELTTASFNGDISTLASFMADDYVGTNADGSTQNKNQVRPRPSPTR
jgi:hypothetical protein